MDMLTSCCQTPQATSNTLQAKKKKHLRHPFSHFGERRKKTLKQTLTEIVEEAPSKYSGTLELGEFEFEPDDENLDCPNHYCWLMLNDDQTRRTSDSDSLEWPDANFSLKLTGGHSSSQFMVIQIVDSQSIRDNMLCLAKVKLSRLCQHPR